MASPKCKDLITVTEYEEKSIMNDASVEKNIFDRRKRYNLRSLAGNCSVLLATKT